MVEKIHKMITDAGFKPEPYPLPLKRIPQELAAGKIDLWIGVVGLPLLKEGAFIGDMTVLKLRLSTWSLGQNIKISSLEDFRKHPVALMFFCSSTTSWIYGKKKTRENVFARTLTASSPAIL